MIDYCARPGCGAPKAWHTNKSTVADLGVGFLHHYAATPNRVEPSCLGNGCLCTSYLAPEPPEPERKPYVVEMTKTDEHLPLLRTRAGEPALAVPLDEFLAAHPQPEPKRCICGGREDEHHDGMACLHVVKFMNRGGTIVRMVCQCERFREAQT